jgi:hypothetical protein
MVVVRCSGWLTIARLVEAVPRVAVRCEDGDLVPALLQRNSSIDNKTLGTANTEVRVEEDSVLLLLCHVWVLAERVRVMTLTCTYMIATRLHKVVHTVLFLLNATMPDPVLGPTHPGRVKDDLLQSDRDCT